MQTTEIIRLGENVLDGQLISYEEAIGLNSIAAEDIPLLAAYANKIRAKFAGKTVDMCGIISARAGHCSEDCKFCAQSLFHKTGSPVYPLLSAGQIVDQAQRIEAAGAARVSIVTSGKGMENDPAFHEILEIIAAVQQATRLQVCANLGTINQRQAVELASAGVRRYAHNLETSARYYPQVCSSHPFEERLRTIEAAKAAGMELCCGGIIGMGETWQDRMELAFTLQQYDVASIPVNILNPIKGTAMEGIIPPKPLEIVKTFAALRFILPDKVLRPAGGRELNLRDMQGAVMLAGANGLIVGNYLTFSGRDTAMDFTMVLDAGLIPGQL